MRKKCKKWEGLFRICWLALLLFFFFFAFLKTEKNTIWKSPKKSYYVTWLEIRTSLISRAEISAYKKIFVHKNHFVFLTHTSTAWHFGPQGYELNGLWVYGLFASDGVTLPSIFYFFLSIYCQQFVVVLHGICCHQMWQYLYVC